MLKRQLACKLTPKHVIHERPISSRDLAIVTGVNLLRTCTCLHTAKSRAAMVTHVGFSRATCCIKTPPTLTHSNITAVCKM